MAADATDRSLPAGRYKNFETADGELDTSDGVTSFRDVLPQRPGTRRPRPETVSSPTAVPPLPEGPAAGAAAGTRAGNMRSSSLHLRSDLVQKVIDERTSNATSNGQVIIAALEVAAPHFTELLPPVAEPTGGGLFATRTSRAPRVVQGPHSALNVRLFEADFTVLDQLVTTHGARSRSHLVDTALAYYFDHH